MTFKGFEKDSPFKEWLKSIVGSFTKEQIKDFLQFATGSSRVAINTVNFSVIIQKEPKSEGD